MSEDGRLLAWATLPGLFDSATWNYMGVPDAEPTGLSTEQGDVSKPPKRGRQPSSRRGSSSAAGIVELEATYKRKLAEMQELSLAKRSLEEKAWVLEQIFLAREAEMARLEEIRSKSIEEDPFVLLGTSLEVFASADNEAVMETCKDVQTRTGNELLIYETTGEITPELKKLGKGMVDAVKYMMGVRPNLDMYNGLHVDTVFPDQSVSESTDTMPAPAEEHWKQVASMAKLSQEQLARCHVFRTLVKGWHTRITDERKRLSGALAQSAKSTAAARDGARAAQPDQGGERRLSLPQDDITARLMDNFEKERSLNMLIMEMLYERIFDMIQTCRIVVHSFPYMPDEMLILDQLSALYLANAGEATQP